MDAFDKLALKADLSELTCELNHHHDNKKQPAIDYITHLFVNEQDQKRYFIIPICKDCVETITGGEWQLFVCATCYNSVWSHKLNAKTVQESAVTIVPYCPHCAESQGND